MGRGATPQHAGAVSVLTHRRRGLGARPLTSLPRGAYRCPPHPYIHPKDEAGWFERAPYDEYCHVPAPGQTYEIPLSHDLIDYWADEAVDDLDEDFAARAREHFRFSSTLPVTVLSGDNFNPARMRVGADVFLVVAWGQPIEVAVNGWMEPGSDDPYVCTLEPFDLRLAPADGRFSITHTLGTFPRRLLAPGERAYDLAAMIVTGTLTLQTADDFQEALDALGWTESTPLEIVSAEYPRVVIDSDGDTRTVTAENDPVCLKAAYRAGFTLEVPAGRISDLKEVRWVSEPGYLTKSDFLRARGRP